MQKKNHRLTPPLFSLSIDFLGREFLHSNKKPVFIAVLLPITSEIDADKIEIEFENEKFRILTIDGEKNYVIDSLSPETIEKIGKKIRKMFFWVKNLKK